MDSASNNRYTQTADYKVKRYTRTEHALQDQIAKALVRAGYLVIRLNSGKSHTASGSFLRSYTIVNNGKSAGASDLIAFKDGQTWFIEVKKAGGKQSETQRQFEALCNQHNMVYVIADHMDDIRGML